jgi:predicted MFS family arabinose efflux permease
MMESSSLFGGIGRALSNPVFRRYFISNTFSTIGRWLHRMAVGWLTWELTESTSWLGIVAFADTFPMVVVSLIAGAVADRMGYLRVIRFGQLGAGCVTALFAALTLTGVISIEAVVALTFVFGSLEALSTPARMSLVHSMVRRDDLSPAIALGSAMFNAARLVGPAIAGVLILWLDIGTVMAISSLTFLQFFIIVLFIRVDESGRDRKLSLEVFVDIVTGVKYVLGDPGIRFLMILLGATGILIRPFMELLPGFAAQVFGRGPDGLAILMSSIGFGGLIAGLWLAHRGQTGGLTKLVTLSLLISGVSLALFTVTGYIWLAACFLVSVGFFMLLGGISSQTLMQNAVDSAMRARVMSLFVVISWGLPAFGALAEGWLASLVGLQPVVAAGALVAIVMWLWARPAGRRLAAELERAGS